MPLFRCSKCGCIENTALSNYWTRRFKKDTFEKLPPDQIPPPLCSACDPDSETNGRWHGRFEKQSADGMLVGEDGFLYSEEEFARKQVHHTKPRGRIVDGQELPL